MIAARSAPHSYRQMAMELLIAASMASLVWLYSLSRTRETIDQVQVPVQMQLAPTLKDLFQLEEPTEAKVELSFSGPPSRLRELRRKLQRGHVTVPAFVHVPGDRMGDSVYSTNVRVDPSTVVVPPGVSVELTDESVTIPVSLHRLAEKTVPVKLEAATDLKLQQVKIEPPSVIVRGPKTVIDRIEILATQRFAPQVNLEMGQETQIREQVSLPAEFDGRPILVTPRVVQVRCKVVPKNRIYELQDLPVAFLVPPNAEWKPRFESERAGKVALKLVGPVIDGTPPVQVYVDLTRKPFPKGKCVEAVRVQLPKEFTVLGEATPAVPFVLEDLETPKPMEKEPAKEPAKEPMKSPAKESQKEPTKSPDTKSTDPKSPESKSPKEAEPLPEIDPEKESATSPVVGPPAPARMMELDEPAVSASRLSLRKRPKD